MYHCVRKQKSASAFTAIFISCPSELGGNPQFYCSLKPFSAETQSNPPISLPVPVLHLQLHPGTDFLLSLPEGQLRAEDVDHDGGFGGLQHHPAAHSRPRPGRLQPGLIREVTCVLFLLLGSFLGHWDRECVLSQHLRATPL